MSFKHVAFVFDDEYYTRANKAKLLVALAIAESANEQEGRACPGVEYLAQKARTSGRGVQTACRELERDGRLYIEYGKGPRGTNIYTVLVPPAAIAPRNQSSEESPTQAREEASGRCTQIYKAPSEPIRNHQESPPNPQRGETAIASVSKPKQGREKKFNKTPTAPEAIWVANLFRRKLTTKWSIKEVRAYLEVIDELRDEECRAMIEAYYRFERAKGDAGIQRRDILTFLNNFTGECDRAREWVRKNPEIVAKFSHAGGDEAARTRQLDVEPEGFRAWLRAEYPDRGGIAWIKVPAVIRNEWKDLPSAERKHWVENQSKNREGPVFHA